MTERNSDTQFSGALRISLMYLALGGLWILFSDKAVEALTPDPDTLTILSILKGWIFIIVTAILLYWLIRQYASTLREVDRKRIETIQAHVTELEQAEQVLHESEERFRKTFRSVPVGLAITRGSDGTYIDANDAFSKITGFSHKELTDQTSLKLNITTPEQRRIYTQQISEQGFIHNQEMLLKNKSGESRMVLGSMEIIVLNHETCVLSTAIDVTERKHAEEALLTSEYNYRSILEQASDGIFIADPDGRYIEVNPSGCEMLGYTREEILAKKMSDLISPEDLTATPVRMDELRQGKNFLSERRMICKDGSLLLVEISARMLSDGRFQGIVRDITERKLVEGLLLESEERYRLIAENTVDVIWIMDLSTRQFTYVSPSVYKLRGYTVEEVMAQSVASALTSKSNEHINSTLPPRIKAVEAGDESARTRTVEVDQPCKDGSIVQTEVVTTLLTDPSGHVVSVLGVSRDITERKQSEKVLRESEERFSKAFHANPAAMIITRMSDGHVIDVNESYEKNLGYKHEELIGKTGLNLNIFDDPGERQKIVEQLREHDSVHSYETKLRTKSGEIRDVLFSLERVQLSNEPCILSIFFDVTERKKAEKALHESEDKFKYFFEHSPVGKSLTLPTGEVNANRAMCDMLGYTLAEFKDKKWQEITHTEDIELTQREVEQLLSGKRDSVRFVKRFIRKDGAVVWVDLSSSLRRDADGKPLYMMSAIIDITDRVRAENELKESEERFSKAFYTSPVPQAIIAQETSKIMEINDANCRLFGYSREELVDSITSKLNLWENPIDRQSAVEELQKTGHLLPREASVRVKSGTMCTLIAAIEPISWKGLPCFIVSMNDITERKQAEEEIHQLNETLEQRIEERTAELSDLYNNAPCGYHSLNVDGVFVHINQTELNWLGYRFEELIGKVNITSLLTPPSVEVFKKNFPVFRETGVLNNLELEFMRKDGSVLPVLLSASAIRDQAGRYVESRTTLVDYTERKRIQEEMLKSKTQLEAANRELESFSYSVSHDLRSPLRGIDGWSLALLEDYGHLLDAHGMSHIQKVREEVQRMGVLIDDILNLSRITRAEMKKTNIDLSAIAETVVTRLQETKPEERQVEFVIQKGLTALGDPKLLDVVLTNLLGNAFKFTGKKQLTHIEFGQTIIESEPAFFVRDNGAGFEMAYANKLFGAFQRMHRASEFPGTGIGLATVQRIITRHGGSVWASSELNQGSTFYFTLEDHTK